MPALVCVKKRYMNEFLLSSLPAGRARMSPFLCTDFARQCGTFMNGCPVLTSTDVPRTGLGPSFSVFGG